MIPSIKLLYQSPAYRLALVIMLVCVSLQYAGLTEALRFERDRIDSGQWWLLLTGNFVHLGNSHLWMNMAGLALVISLVWTHFNATQWLLLILLCSLFVGLGLYVLNPELYGYVGFSGTLHGLMLAGVIADLKLYPRSAGVLLVLICGKLLWEQIAGALPGSEATAGGSVIVDAHLYGAIAGATLGLLLLIGRHYGFRLRQHRE